ncbi:MAG: hypothetical protein JXO72_15155 [Vicinamibacteria bacterium]|nr:hypothetical protein [Vicinamibacteria bacterium]
MWLVFNGEAYDFRELRKDIEARHRFLSQGDAFKVTNGTAFSNAGSPIRKSKRSGFFEWLNGSRPLQSVITSIPFSLM